MGGLTDQKTMAFMQAIVKYYGKYRGDGTYEAVGKWLEKQNLSRSELAELYSRLVENITTQYNNVPDIAQIRPYVDNITTWRPAPKELADPAALPIDQAASRMSELLEHITKKNDASRDTKNATRRSTTKRSET